MARRKSYSRNRKSSTGRIIALLVLFSLVILVIWQFRNSSDDPIEDLSLENIEAAIVAQAQANSSQPVDNTQVTNNTPPAVAAVNPIRKQQEPPVTSPPVETVTQRNPNTQKQLGTSVQQQANTVQVAQTQQKAIEPPPPVVMQPTVRQEFTRNPAAEEIFFAGKAAFEAKDIIAARNQLSEALNLGLNNNLDELAREMINQGADLWLFSRNIFPNDPFCSRHTVESGQYLSTIARKYIIPHELISRMNGITDPSKLKAGQAIKVVQGPFHAKVELSKFRLTVYLGEVMVKSYDISIGKPGRETPTGLWKVELKQPNPAWTDPDSGVVFRPNDPGNPLGTRWIALEGLEGNAVGRTGIGIHGTITPGEIGQQASRGCIRLFNGNVQELYDLMVPGKSQIWVVE